MNTTHPRIIFIAGAVLAVLFSGCASVPYRARNQMELHDRISADNPHVAVLPFTLRTPSDNSSPAFEDLDVRLTNKFIEVIWKKNKVRLVNKDTIMAALQAANLTYDELDPEMNDLTSKPNIAKIIEVGKALEADLVFIGTVRKNKMEYEGGPVPFLPSVLASKKHYNVGAQIMAVDIDREEILAFDYIDNRIPVQARLLGVMTLIDKDAQAKAEEDVLDRCGFALAYYIPMPEQRTDTEAMALKTGAALLKHYTGTEINIDTSIQDETWQLYPEGYFMENLGYTRMDFDSVPRD
ncbi:MAG: hypothetical protein JSW54_06255 [Fidelibacterota bacterium]|nr:MAG: hypothetical protein JSW54_06255 [Candidatus Neomarinimicrobiota bacterium]